MRFQHSLSLAAVVVLAACGPQRQPQAPTNNAEEPVVPAPSAPPGVKDSAPAAAPQPGTGGGLPDERIPIAEPEASVDPKSAEAAGQMVQHYGALIEEGRFGEAEKLWGDAGAAGREAADLKSYSEAHFEVGKPTGMEGAAGSTFITVPIVLYGRLSGGKSFNRSGNVVVRRVNDVTGSTEAQRRWHIERIEWSETR